MTAVLWAALGALGAMLATAIGALASNLVGEELRGRLDRAPRALIRLAARRLPRDVREDQAAEWVAELHAVLHDTEKLPITRLYRGIRFALGLLWAAPTIGRTISTQAVGGKLRGILLGAAALVSLYLTARAGRKLAIELLAERQRLATAKALASARGKPRSGTG